VAGVDLALLSGAAIAAFAARVLGRRASVGATGVEAMEAARA
jgi:hypothetical protein